MTRSNFDRLVHRDFLLRTPPRFPPHPALCTSVVVRDVAVVALAVVSSVPVYVVVDVFVAGGVGVVVSVAVAT